MRLIDADALLEKANVYRCDFGFVDDPDVDIFDAVKVEHIENAPTVNAAPVRNSKWEIDPDGYYPCCAACGNEPQGRVMTDYCPNCGARMNGGVHNAESSPD